MMCMDLNRHKEMFSIAYINAVAARVGLELAQIRYDVDGVDGMLVSSGGTAPQVNFQAKSTSRRDVWRDDYVALALPKTNYDFLREPKFVPRILIVVLLPEDQADWLTQTPDQLCLRRCAYWISLRDAPDVPNQSTKTVRIPTDKMFDQVTLTGMLDRIGRGELP